MMQRLLILAASERRPEVPPARGLVTRDDALDAVLQVAAVIDEATHAGHVPVERGVYGAAMLMLIRDYIQPLAEVYPASDDRPLTVSTVDDCSVDICCSSELTCCCSADNSDLVALICCCA